MNTEKVRKDTKLILLATLVIGVGLLAAGLLLRSLNIDQINHKAIIGLSFIPLAVAAMSYYKLNLIKKDPNKIRDILINESDERLVAVNNEADAKAFRIVQGLLFLAYMGYTLMVPKDIFESIGWWILLVLLFVTFITQGVFRSGGRRRDQSTENDE